jgi:hypothetical protein
MQHRSLHGAARFVALLAFLIGVAALGAQPSAWATPSQAPAAQTVPTRTPGSAPGPRLGLADVHCSGEDVRVEFLLNQLPSDVTDFGAVTYVVNGQTRTASFDRLTGGVAHYVGTIPAAEASDNGSYDITAATVTITTSGGQITATLSNPRTATAACRRPQPQRPSQQPCSVGPIREAVGPSTAVQLASCQWSLAVAGNALGRNGTIELTQVSPAVSFGANPGDSFFGQHVELTFFDQAGNPVAQPSFAGTVQLCASYTADDLARVGRPSTFVIQTFDVAARRWVALPTTPDPANSRVCATLPHLSRYALAARLPQPAATGVQPVRPGNLPVTGGFADLTIPGWLWLLTGLSVGVGVALVVRRRANI